MRILQSVIERMLYITLLLVFIAAVATVMIQYTITQQIHEEDQNITYLVTKVKDSLACTNAFLALPATTRAQASLKDIPACQKYLTP